MRFALWRDRLVLRRPRLASVAGRYIKESAELLGAPWEQGTASLFALEVLIPQSRWGFISSDRLALRTEEVRRAHLAPARRHPADLRLHFPSSGRTIPSVRSSARSTCSRATRWPIHFGFSGVPSRVRARGVRHRRRRDVRPRPLAIVHADQFRLGPGLGIASHPVQEAGVSRRRDRIRAAPAATALLPHPNVLGA